MIARGARMITRCARMIARFARIILRFAQILVGAIIGRRLKDPSASLGMMYILPFIIRTTNGRPYVVAFVFVGDGALDVPFGLTRGSQAE